QTSPLSMSRHISAVPDITSIKMPRLQSLKRGSYCDDARKRASGSQSNLFFPCGSLRSPSGFPNLFDLEQREPVAHGFHSSDCNSLSGVVSEFRVHWLFLAHQQIDLTVLAFYADRQAPPNARFCAFSVLRTAQIVGDVAGHIKHFALDDDFLPLYGGTLDDDLLPLREWMPSALREIQPKRGYARQDT